MKRFHWLSLGVILFLNTPLSSQGAIGDVIRVLTLNVWFGVQEMDFRRLETQIEKVRELKPDVVCLQELFDPKAKRLYRKSMEGFQGYAADVNTRKSKLLEPFLPLFSTPGRERFVYGDRNGLMLLLNQETGSSTERSKKLYEYRMQSKIGWKSWMADFVKPKAYLSMDYEFHQTPVTVITTHLSVGEKDPHRTDQVYQLALAASGGNLARPKNQNPVILCGDTNADASFREMIWLRDSAGFKDTFLEKYPNPELAPHKGATWDNEGNPHVRLSHVAGGNQRVDYVYYYPGADTTFEVQDFQIVFDREPFVSDHYGVLVDLKIIPKQNAASDQIEIKEAGQGSSIQ